MKRKSVRKKVSSVPVVGYTARVVKNVVKSPGINQQLADNQRRTDIAITELRNAQEKQIVEIRESMSKLNELLASVQLTQDNLQQQFSLLNISKSTKVDEKNKVFADDHILDNFYSSFEDRFRGSEKLIAERLTDYLPYFKNSKIDFKSKPILDIGSGRGELLQLLKSHKYNAIGLDINHDMVERSKKKGLNAVQGDALDFLQQSKPQSYGAITGFHLVEHIPFNILLRIFMSIHSALTQNGFVIFETPNPENLTVGSTTFYMDPSHLHPLPPPLLAFALETCGFRNIEIKLLHPHEDFITSQENLSKNVATLIYGPRDYAVIGYK